MNGAAPTTQNKQKASELLNEEDEDQILSSIKETKPTINKTETKKIKIAIELDPMDLEELKVLTLIGLYKTKEDFIVEAIQEKKAEVMAKIKSAVKKK